MWRKSNDGSVTCLERGSVGWSIPLFSKSGVNRSRSVSNVVSATCAFRACRAYGGVAGCTFDLAVRHSASERVTCQTRMDVASLNEHFCWMWTRLYAALLHCLVNMSRGNRLVGGSSWLCVRSVCVCVCVSAAWVWWVGGCGGGGGCPCVCAYVCACV